MHPRSTCVGEVNNLMSILSYFLRYVACRALTLRDCNSYLARAGQRASLRRSYGDCRPGKMSGNYVAVGCTREVLSAGLILEGLATFDS